MFTFAPLVPIFSWVLLIATTGVLLTTPLQYRLYGFPALLILVTISFRTIHHLTAVPGLPDLWGLVAPITFIHCTSLLYLKKWTLRVNEDSRNETQSRNDPWLHRDLWIRMYRAASNPRFIRIPYKHIILGEQGIGTQVKSTATHRKFSTARIGRLLVKIGILFLLNDPATIRMFGGISINDLTPAKASILRRLLHPIISRSVAAPVSAREVMLRLWFTVTALWTPVILLDALHAAIAIFFIYIVRVDTPEDWPDLFGSPSEAYTIGRFWMSVWHRLHLSGYSDVSNYLIAMLPRSVSRNAVIKRLFVTFSLFLISALIHQLTEWQLHSTYGDYADLRFFSMNAVGVSLEYALLRCTRTSATSEGGNLRIAGRREKLQVALVRVIGYVWVVGFFVWAIPKCYYQRAYHAAVQQARHANHEILVSLS
ncbi:hypothetical protein LTR84_004426 [Exophiala bonariae]|uniref:Wax synthase domain-containing protein n=1 Tax=Exophiala bonariae TaxID=1690606 RepID=A0AAV9N841_9EURO|nr:hypothetical protein LTR84_004426 [Exophiala bonariae]